MSLQEDLNRFKKQQEKCQATLTNIAAKAAAVKFSRDTQRLQYINNIRKGPVGAQIKRVIDLLFGTRQALTPEQINAACYVDINSNKVVFDSLKNNPKVSYDGRYFAYKSKHDLKDKNQLLDLIHEYPDGIAVIDLKDAYPTVMEDVQALKAVGLIWLLSNYDSQEDIAYPNDPKTLFKADNDIKLLFRAIELPQEMIDVEKDLQKNGMKPATNSAHRREMDQIHGFLHKPNKQDKKKKRRNEITKRTKLTNFYLPELFK